MGESYQYDFAGPTGNVYIWPAESSVSAFFFNVSASKLLLKLLIFSFYGEC